MTGFGNEDIFSILRDLGNQIIDYSFFKTLNGKSLRDFIIPLIQTEIHISLLDSTFIGFGLYKTIKEITKACDLYFTNIPGEEILSSIKLTPSQRWETYPRENWQVDFTQMLLSQGNKYLSVFIDNFMGGMEPYPLRTEQAQEDAKKSFLNLDFLNLYKLTMTFLLLLKLINNCPLL